MIWDLDKQGSPITPGTASSRQDEIECVAWNNNVAHILAAAGNTGFTSVWDLKNRREVLHLFYPGPGGAGRRGVSSVIWHPENVSHISFTASVSFTDRCCLNSLLNSSPPVMMMLRR